MKNGSRHLGSSMARKNKKNLDKEFTREQRYRKEIEKLKRENSRLRKLLARIDLEQHLNLKEAVLKKEKEDQVEKAIKKQNKEEQAWRCYQCHEGTLRLKIFEMRDGARYYRKCDSCPNRTKGKKYTPDVRGVK